MTLPRLALLLAPFALMPALTPITATAQETAIPPAEVGEAAELPTMAEIEQAWARGDFVFARQGLQRLAEETGTALAQYRYGRILLEGRGGPLDVNEAVVWLDRAAKQNNAAAATLLARVLLTKDANGKAPDAPHAAALLSNAAARGHAEAQYYLGLLYQSGTGIEMDLTAAFNWFLAAAEQQHVESQYLLARAYSRGDGTEESPVEAERWLAEAASGGHTEAQFFLALAMDTGRGTALNRGQAVQWFRRAAESGYPLAQRWLGQKYLMGDGVEGNAQEALRWLSEAAKAQDATAMFLLGEAYAGKYVVPADLAKAWQMYNRAKEFEYLPAFTALARMLETGTGVTKDLEAAVGYYRHAAANGDEAAVLELGRLAGEGRLEGLAPPHLTVPWAVTAASEGDNSALDWLRAQADGGLRPARTAYGMWLLNEEQDPAGAAGYFLPAAEAGDTNAQHQYGLLLIKGEGVEQDYIQAHGWLNIAAAGGNAQAAKMRGVVSDLMTPEQIAEAQTFARDFFDRVARTGPVISESAQP